MNYPALTDGVLGGKRDNMNSKERVRIALSFEEPDRVPVSADYFPEIKRKLSRIMGMKKQIWELLWAMIW